MKNRVLRFADVFAGLGGFHVALGALGHECVFASELDSDLKHLYKRNFGLKPHGDIRECWSAIPDHDVLCAGFPCQPFSKAGGQKGLNCPDSGDLFDYIVRVLTKRKPEFLLLENVPNLVRHDGGATWLEMQDQLRSAGYAVACKILSPVMFGIPQKRDRAIIIGRRFDNGGLEGFEWPEASHTEEDASIVTVLDKLPNNATPLPEVFNRYLAVWQEFLDLIPADTPLPSFPIWAMEFGADYPIDDIAPVVRSRRSLSRYKGQFGQPLRGMTTEERIFALPPYARRSEPFPEWKKRFIRQNRAFFAKHREMLRDWLPKIKNFAPSFQKFEWNWKDGPRSLDDKIVQFRASGIRVKRPNVAPSLVALTTSQVPVVTWEKRYMTMRECARLQSLGDLQYLPTSKTKAHHALGNAVNATVIERVAAELLSFDILQTPDTDASQYEVSHQLDTPATTKNAVEGAPL